MIDTFQKLYIANFAAFCDLYRTTIKSLETLPQNVFDDFESFSIGDQVRLGNNNNNNNRWGRALQKFHPQVRNDGRHLFHLEVLQAHLEHVEYF